ncbi:MAG: type II secretion system F family protein [Candidatus Nealsonbacteria bacterium]|nr:type II secretion system F family protein [Candidatus Nealsonbacteria bacterium]
MPNTQPSKSPAISLDELTALNAEIAALVRAGVPLEKGLAELSDDMPGRLGRLAADVARRCERGEPLGDVLADPALSLPPVYRAVVVAGIRAGRLPAALETLSTSVRNMAETRRTVITATIYPVVVFALAWTFLAFFTAKLAPNLLEPVERMDVAGRGMLAWLVECGRWAIWWGPVVPIAAVVVCGVYWLSARRATSIEPRLAGRLFGWLPWMGRAMRWSRTATYVEILAMLIENQVPLDESVVLAAEAAGGERLHAAATRLAETLQQGALPGDQSPGEAVRQSLRQAEFPPLLCWLMAAGQRKGALLPALRSAARTYRHRAHRQAELARVFLPVVLTGLVGGSIVLLYALILFAPYASILEGLASPP